MIKINIKNFKQLENFRIEIKKLTLIFGPNGSGKSSLLQALYFLSENLKAFNKNHKKQFLTKYELEAINFYSYKNIVSKNKINKSIKFIIEVNGSYKELKSFFHFFNITVISPHESPDRESDISQKIENLKTYENLEELLYSTDEILKKEKEKLKFHLVVKFDKKTITDYYLKDLNTKIVYDFIKGEWKIPNNFKLMSLIISKIYFSPSSFERNLLFNLFDNKSNETQLNDEIISDKTKLLESIEILVKFNFIFGYVLSRFFNLDYILPVRNKPKEKYLLKNGKFTENIFGNFPLEFFITKCDIDELRENWNKRKKLTLEEEVKIFGMRDGWIQLFKTLAKFNLAKSIFTVKKGEIGYLKIKHINDSITGISQTSSGLFHIFPILFHVLMMENKFLDTQGNFHFTLIIEQPEIHLHPKLHALLAEFLAEKLQEITNPIIIETHSEHFVKKIQVLHAQKKITENDYSIYYFDNSKGVTEVKKIELDEYGFLKEPWPNGFFDDYLILTEELIFGARNN